MDRSIENALRDAAQGLLYRSESTQEFDAFTWPGGRALTPEMVRELGGHDTSAEVRPTTLEKFFQGMTTEETWHNEEEKAAVILARTLVKLIQDRLQNPQVFRVGQTEVTIHIVGRTPDDDYAGLTTFAVET